MTFTAEIYAAGREGTKRSAERIVPPIYSLLKPRTVIDVGCGEGWFAREFAKQGCYVVGIDPAVTPGERDGVLFFNDADATSHEHADLAVCLEVAEHLPADESDELVDALAEVAPLILFSAAIPGQTGHGHINCQWPGYWVSKFMRHGLLVSEDLRWNIWHDTAIEPWYKQNLLLFGEPRTLIRMGLRVTSLPLPVVHPEIWAWKL